MVKIKFLLIIFFISFIAAYAYKPGAIAENHQNKSIVTIKDKKPLNRHKTTVIPTIVLGILVFLVSSLVIFVRIRISKTIKKRRL